MRGMINDPERVRAKMAAQHMGVGLADYELAEEDDRREALLAAGPKEYIRPGQHGPQDDRMDP